MNFIDDIPIDQNDIDVTLAFAIELEEAGEIHKSMCLLKLCAFLGDATAICKLADMLSDYDELLDIPLAERLYKIACLSGYEVACYNLGIMLDKLGRSVEAQKFYSRAPSLLD